MLWGIWYRINGDISFKRILKFNDFSMTSGLSFVFNTSYENKLFNGINLIKRNISGHEKMITDVYKFVYKINSAAGNKVKMFQA